MMVEDFQYESYTDHIILSWTAPEYPPYYYERITKCALNGEDELYYHEWPTIDPNDVTNVVESLRPNSNCEITFYALYNKISLDDGIKVDVPTPASSRFRKILCMLQSFYTCLRNILLN